MRAIGKKIIARPLQRDIYQRGSIIIPTIATKDHWLGEVVVAGDEVTNVHPGEVVIAPAYTAVEFEVEGQEYRAYHLDNILAVFSREEIFGG